MSDRDEQKDPARTPSYETRQLGDLVATAYDEAAEQCDDPAEVSRVAADAVMRLLERARPPFDAPRLLSPPMRRTRS